MISRILLTKPPCSLSVCFSLYCLSIALRNVVRCIAPLAPNLNLRAARAVSSTTVSGSARKTAL